MMMWLRQFLLLMWKNLILRRRHFIITAFELLLPPLLSLTMKPFSGSFGAHHQRTSIPKLSEEGYIMNYAFSNKSQPYSIAYAPTNIFTMDVMQSVEKLAENYSGNIGFIDMSTHEDIMRMYANVTGSRDYRSYDNLIGILFDGPFLEDEKPKEVTYRIMLSPYAIMTDELYFSFGRRESAYITEKFSAIQIAVDKGITEILCSDDCSQQTLPKINAQKMPSPPDDRVFVAGFIMQGALPLLLCLGFMFLCGTVIKGVVNEKETGIKELMKMMGMSEFMSWFTWMINAMMVLTISITITVILLSIDYTGENSGGVIKQTDSSMFWVFLMLYAMASVTFCFVISALMKKPNPATALGFILWLVTFFFPWIYIQTSYKDMSLSDKLGLCLLPNGALALGMKAMSIYVEKGLPLGWTNIHIPGSSVDGLSLLYVFIMLLVDIVLYLFITWYVSCIMPGNYGVAQPWYFVFMPSYWCPKRQKMSKGMSSEASSSESQIEETSFEREPSDLPVGISIRDIHKVFTPLTGQSKTAVDGVSLNIYEGQITALLGHNGAGKTTLMSILTGLFSPTRGTAVINGYDIRKNMQKVQKDLSLCPQHNMLFDELTVMNHMQVFGMLKGLNRSEVMKEGKELMEKLGIADKSNKLSSSLSGGQKRKLCLAIALIGGSKVVMLDEPTSGMDPEARRGVWDLLLGLRGHKTIIITTHFMEEADVLGDRIAIMAHGKVQCYGSSLFLKKHYGTGYSLKMTVHPECDINKVTATVQKNISDSHLKSVMGSEVSYLLPTDKTADFPSLFEALDANKNVLGIDSFGVSLTTMDEVFLKVGEIADRGKHDSSLTSYVSSSTLLATELKKNYSTCMTSQTKTPTSTLLLQQTLALFRKLRLHSLRKWKSLVFQAIIPILLTLICLYSSAKPSTAIMPNKMPPLTLTLDAYKDRGPVFFTSENDQAGYSSFYEEMLGGLGENKTGQNMTSEFLEVASKGIETFQEKYIVAADFNNPEDEPASVTAMYGISAIHGLGISINLIDNAVLKAMAGPDYLITTINDPFPLNSRLHFEVSAGPVMLVAYSLMFAIFLFIGLAVLVAAFVTFPIHENVSQSKQLQLMTGVSPCLYWLTFLLWDMLIYLVIVCLIMICFVAVDDRGIYTSGNGLGAVFLLLFAFGWGGITASYLVSFRAKTVGGGYAFATFMHILIGIAGAVTLWILHQLGDEEEENTVLILEWIFQLFPAFPACYGLLLFSLAATSTNKCSYVAKEAIKMVCSNPQMYNNTRDYDMLACCDVCKPDGTCNVPMNYVTWKMNITEDMQHIRQSSYGVGRAVVFMILDGFIHLMIILLLESGLLKRAWNKVISRKITTDQASLDEDVQHENSRVTALPLGTSTFVVKDLSKNFGSFTAVRNVSFAIEHSECFGLLGVNGAGKTTTFRMLTGDEIPSSGTAYLLGKNVTDARRAYLSDIGYCPQFDAIIDVLTGEEMLELYASLRGIRGGDDRVQEVGRWVRNLGLEEHRSRPCGTYSGGNKRKLSTAIALIGDPKVVFLDEPTSGVDPSARRKLWQVLAQIKSTGQAVILTSHSMEECEALCSRLAIMVNGQFQCLGGPQHIKSKFGKGFTVVLKLKQGSEVANQEGEVSALKSRVESTLAPCVLKDEHQGLLHYHVTSTTMSWPFLFRTMESLKNEVDMIEDYSISETTLEQVFLSFARQQRQENKAEGTCCKCCG